MANKKDYIKFCRYYKGEKDNPYKGGYEALFWDYEKGWVEASLIKFEFLFEYISDYIGVGLRDFEKTDDTPLSLKALLFNRFCHWDSGSAVDCVEPFMDFYLNVYIKNAAD